MKKLMIAAAAAMLGIVANAAVANWKATAGNIFVGDGTDTKYAGTVYVFDSATYTQQALFDAYAANSSFDFGSVAVATLSAANGSIVTTSSANQFSYGEGGSSYAFYLVIADDDQIYFSNSKNGTGPQTATPANLTFGSQNDSSTTFSKLAPAGDGFQGAGKWSAVPEPTSGLLLLLGVAGLALKRRRA